MGSSLPLKCPTSGFMCPGAVHDLQFKGSLPIEIVQGRQKKLQNVTRHRCHLALQLSMSSEDFRSQQGALEGILARVYGVTVSLQMQAASVRVAVITANLNDTAVEEFVRRVHALDNAAYSEELHIDTAVLSPPTVDTELVEVVVDVAW
eukprot:2706732-Prymnesium_polylepis.1